VDFSDLGLLLVPLAELPEVRALELSLAETPEAPSTEVPPEDLSGVIVAEAPPELDDLTVAEVSPELPEVPVPDAPLVALPVGALSEVSLKVLPAVLSPVGPLIGLSILLGPARPLAGLPGTGVPFSGFLLVDSVEEEEVPLDALFACAVARFAARMVTEPSKTLSNLLIIAP
jgi:hypothetical protein